MEETKYLVKEVVTFVGGEITLPDGAIQVGVKVYDPVLDGKNHYRGLGLYYLIPKEETE